MPVDGAVFFESYISREERQLWGLQQEPSTWVSWAASSSAELNDQFADWYVQQLPTYRAPEVADAVCQRLSSESGRRAPSSPAASAARNITSRAIA